MAPEAPHTERRMIVGLGMIGQVQIKCDKLLDIGCSDGKYTIQIAKALNATSMVGVDINMISLEKAKTRGIDTFLVDLDENPLPFADGQFDFVYCSEVIEHIANTDKLIGEIERVLTPGGYLLLSTPNLACWVNRLILLFGWQPIYTEVSFIKHYGTPFGYSRGYPVGHIRPFTLKALKAFLTDKGYRLVSVKGYAALEHPLLIPLDRIIAKLSVQSATGLLCLCRKGDQSLS